MKAKRKAKQVKCGAKQAILAANIPHGDVALRAIAAVDNNPEFRHAIEALIEAKDDEGERAELIRKFVAGQFKPGKPKDNAYTSAKRRMATLIHDMRTGAKGVQAKEVYDLLNAAMLNAAQELLSNDNLKHLISKRITQRLDELLMALMGLNQSCGRLEIDYHEESAIRSKLEGMVKRVIDGPVTTWLKDIDLKDVLRKKEKNVIAQLRKDYRHEFEDQLYSRIQKLATKKAKLDLDKLLAKLGEEKQDEEDEEDGEGDS